MPRISLRAYEKEIEDLIDQNHLQEAIQHCKHILKFYPKNISTYRILGKAFLEGKQFNETVDIFKRVLTVFPDDFISHVGMSIVRENENNLDASIWHMELAFDSQPSNIAIQEELKRLFGKRDGMHPAKIRLTRGALVRMYARGELYQQAIAEIQSALVEDAKRPDLEVLLAKMYYLSGDLSDAVELCNKLVMNLPYCYEVNKILAAALPAMKKQEKSQLYSHRLAELNPYEGYINTRYPSEPEVPDEQVLLDKLVDLQITENAVDTNWIDSLGGKWEEPIKGSSSDWLPPEQSSFKDISSNAQNFSPSIQKTPPDLSSLNPDHLTENSDGEAPLLNRDDEITQEKTSIPDWMRSAGWAPSNEEQPAAEQHIEYSSENTPQEEAVSANIPDWLRSLTPADSPILPVQSDNPVEESQNVLKTDEPEPLITDSDSSDQNLQWLNEKASESVNKPESPDQELPDWLQNFEVNEKSDSVIKDDLPEWLNSIQQNDLTNESDQKQENANPFVGIDNVPEPKILAKEELSPASSADTTEKLFTRSLDPSEMSPSQTGEEDNFLPPNTPPLPTNWSSVISSEETEETKPSTSATNDSIPDWVRSVLDKNEEADSQPDSLPSMDEPILKPQISENETIEEKIPSVTDDLSHTEANSEKSGDELLDWLRELKPDGTDNPALSEEESTDQPVEQPNQTEQNTQSFDFDAQLDRLQRLTQIEENGLNLGSELNKNPIEESLDTTKPLEVPENNPASDFIIREDNPAPRSEETIPDKQKNIPDQESIQEETTTAEPLIDVEKIDSQASSNTHESDSNLQETLQADDSDHNDSTNLEELKELSLVTPDRYTVWQLLGDAYAKSGDLKNALLSYSKAEELLLKNQ